MGLASCRTSWPHQLTKVWSTFAPCKPFQNTVPFSLYTFTVSEVLSSCGLPYYFYAALTLTSLSFSFLGHSCFCLHLAKTWIGSSAAETKCLKDLCVVHPWIDIHMSRLLLISLDNCVFYHLSLHSHAIAAFNRNQHWLFQWFMPQWLFCGSDQMSWPLAQLWASLGCPSFLPVSWYLNDQSMPMR